MQETQEMRVRSLGQEDSLEEGMATHSSILVCRNPWTEPGEPGRLQSMGCKESYVTERLSMYSQMNKIRVLSGWENRGRDSSVLLRYR